MPMLLNGNHLADKRYITVVLRLVLDERGQLLHGELIDVEGVLQQRFKGWRGLAQAMRIWFTSRGHEGRRVTKEDESPTQLAFHRCVGFLVRLGQRGTHQGSFMVERSPTTVCRPIQLGSMP